MLFIILPIHTDCKICTRIATEPNNPGRLEHRNARVSHLVVDSSPFSLSGSVTASWSMEKGGDVQEILTLEHCGKKRKAGLENDKRVQGMSISSPKGMET